mmetsp:Transcript_125441/g.354853  ORF Transcript_125441/g.354853 Transcript_125441/m.354853 type:complete len:220 (+) Transcript_125441:235-894(+)
MSRCPPPPARHPPPGAAPRRLYTYTVAPPPKPRVHDISAVTWPTSSKPFMPCGKRLSVATKERRVPSAASFRARRSSMGSWKQSDATYTCVASRTSCRNMSPWMKRTASAAGCVGGVREKFPGNSSAVPRSICTSPLAVRSSHAALARAERAEDSSTPTARATDGHSRYARATNLPTPLPRSTKTCLPSGCQASHPIFRPICRIPVNVTSPYVAARQLC